MASQQGVQEKQRNDHLAALSLQRIPDYFWKNNLGTHFIFSTKILRGSGGIYGGIYYSIFLYCRTVLLS